MVRRASDHPARGRGNHQAERAHSGEHGDEMSEPLPDYLADLYRLEELEGWQLLARHLELMDRFSFVVILAPDDWAIAYIRSQLPKVVGSPKAVRRAAFDPAAGEGSLAESLLGLSPLPKAT